MHDKVHLTHSGADSQTHYSMYFWKLGCNILIGTLYRLQTAFSGLLVLLVLLGSKQAVHLTVNKTKRRVLLKYLDHIFSNK